MVDARVASLFYPDQKFPREQWPKDVRLGYAMYWKNGVRVQWLETYAEVARGFLEQVVVPLREKYPNPDDVRVVFWFVS